MVSVIVACYNQLDYTQKFFNGWRQHLDWNADIEFIVVDNGSTDGTSKYLKDHDFNVLTVITNQKNLGVAPAWNQGAAIAKGKYLLVLNNDIHVGIDLSALLVRKCWWRDGIVGIQGARLDPETFRWVENISDPKNKFDYIVGCCMLIPRKVFDLVGPFDERFLYAGSEDADYSIRVKKSGFKLKLVSGVLNRTVFHHGSKTLMTQRDFDVKEVMLKNCERLKEKWGKLDA